MLRRILGRSAWMKRIFESCRKRRSARGWREFRCFIRLLTRNYLHLYQRLNRRYKGFGYLLPQLMNTVLCLAFATALQAEGLGKSLSTIVAMTLVTIPFYFTCRWFFLEGKAGGESTTGSLP